MVDTRKCAKCGQIKPLELFAKDRRKTMGHAYACRACEAIRKKTYFAQPELLERQAIWARKKYWSEPGPARERRAVYRQTHDEPTAAERDPWKDAARRKLREAVRSGRINKPRQCQDCGAGGVIHGHHHDYAKPLDVEWLCQICHGLRHRKYLEAALRSTP